MIYRDFGKTGCRVSQLGFGAMRFPLTDKEDPKSIDEAKAVEMLHYAVDNGVNYIDTAYVYHGGKSEELVGRAIKAYDREQLYIATKLPMWAVKTTEDFDRLLDEQLARLDTPYIDFYLFHALDGARWELVKELGLIDKMKQAKQSGKIRHMGFSFHDEYPVFKKIVDEFDGCEFCQIQFNYLDTDRQAGIAGVRYAEQKELGLVIMEPLLGGKLCNVPENIKKILPPDKNETEAALSFIWDHSQVSLLLSGMSAMQQVSDNISYAGKYRADELTDAQKSAFVSAKREFERMSLVPCTGCAYCQPCPEGVAIPEIFAAYNKIETGGRDAVRAVMPDIEDRAAKCVGCGRCEAVCPQSIKITDELVKIKRSF